MASITPVPAPPPGDPLDSANALVQSSTVERCVVTSWEDSMPPSLPRSARLRANPADAGIDTLATPSTSHGKDDPS